MEQKILTWSAKNIDYIGGQLKEYLDEKCVDGWYVVHIQPITQTEYQNGNMRLESALIIIQRPN